MRHRTRLTIRFGQQRVTNTAEKWVHEQGSISFVVYASTFDFSLLDLFPDTDFCLCIYWKSKRRKNCMLLFRQL